MRSICFGMLHGVNFAIRLALAIYALALSVFSRPRDIMAQTAAADVALRALCATSA
jgi:hypothetical protein